MTSAPLPEGEENEHFDRKSLKLVTGRSADWSTLASDCVAFANAAGGGILIGIEDDAVAPPADQRVDPDLPHKIQKRVGELTANVTVVAAIKVHENGGQYVEL